MSFFLLASGARARARRLDPDLSRAGLEPHPVTRFFNRSNDASEVLLGRVARTRFSVIALQPETGDWHNTVRVVQRNLSFLVMSFITDAATPCSALRVAPSAFPSLGAGQSSLVMGSPFIKMIFSLLNCAAPQIKGWMFEVDGAALLVVRPFMLHNDPEKGTICN